MKRKKPVTPITPARAIMRPICAFLGVILIFMFTGTVYIRYVVPNLPMIKSVTALASQDAQAPEAPAQTSLLSSNSSRPLHILLIGEDRQEHEEVGRSDAIMLCSYYKETNTFYMTSILRDLYLPIPGYGSDRINAAFAYGGSALLCQTLSQNLGITVDGWVEVDFLRFSEIVELLGGVDLALTQAEAQEVNNALGGSLTEGVQHLSGQQALVYSRLRKLDADGDFSRTNRQRKVLMALIDSYKNAGVTQMLSVLNELLPMVSTDLNALSMLRYALQILPNISQAKFEGRFLPVEGTYSDQMINEMAVLVPDWDSFNKTLAEYFPER